MARRDYSQFEIRQKFRAKGFSDSDIESVITDFLEKNLLNDARFAEIYARHRQEKGCGPIRISAELRQRGISDSVIADHVKITDNAWNIQIKRVWLKQFKGQIATDFKTRAKQMRFLQYRGFTQEQIECLMATLV